MVGKTLVNTELLREGLGVMTPNSSIDPLLLPQFKKLMNEAVKNSAVYGTQFMQVNPML